MIKGKKVSIKLLLTGTLFILFVIWTGWIMLLPFLLLIIDYHVTQFIPWHRLREKIKISKPIREMLDWLGAVLAAVIIVLVIRTLFIEAYTIPTPSMEKTLLVGDYLFVSKISYGPKLPNTPLSFPFTHNIMPFSENRKSYSDRIQLPYKRLKGLRKIKHNDVVVFHFPEGDTVVLQFPEQDYYTLVRKYGRENILRQYKVTSRPVDKRDNFIKRCVALPGDSLEIRHSSIYINHRLLDDPPDVLYNYYVRTTGGRIDAGTLAALNITGADDLSDPDRGSYMMPLTTLQANKLHEVSNVLSVTRLEDVNDNLSYLSFFPYDPIFQWTEDNFGPLFVPEKGSSVRISKENLPLYRRIIENYEKNKLEVHNDTILINDIPAKTYTFKMNYYFMVGDNRHNSADSRIWGFVPEDHIVGKAMFIWLSIDKYNKSFKKFRWNHMFTKIR